MSLCGEYLFLHLHNPCRLHLNVALIHLAYHSSGQLKEGATGEGIRVESYRCTLVATLANTLYDGNLSQQRHLQFLGKLFATVLTKM